MSILSAIPLVGELIEGLSGYAVSRQATKQKREEIADNKLARRDSLEAARHDAEVKRISAIAGANSSLDGAAVANWKFSWKDDWVLLMLSYPFVAGFIPNEELQKSVEVGWKHLALAPLWYQGIFVATIAAIMGLRGWLNRNQQVINKSIIDERKKALPKVN